MSTAVAALAAVVVLAAGCGDDSGTSSTSDASGGIPGAPEERVAYGHIASLGEKDGHWVMRFDPAWFLTGETANVAAAEDGVIEPGEPMPNDNYVVDESHRLYTYLVADDADVFVLTRSGDLGSTTVGVAELERILAGTSDLSLFEPLDTGVWIAYRIDTVDRIVQQYYP